MNADMMVMSILERILEKQDKLLETSYKQGHMLEDLAERIQAVEDKKCDVAESKAEEKHDKAEVQKAWVPVVLKILEIAALFLGAVLGIKAVL